MLIGVVKEIKEQENRVGLTPAGVQALKKAGADVIVETGAGVGSGIADADYARAGAEIVEQAADTWRRSDTHDGHVTCAPVADSQGLESTSLDQLL